MIVCEAVCLLISMTFHLAQYRRWTFPYGTGNFFEILTFRGILGYIDALVKFKVLIFPRFIVFSAFVCFSFA